MSSLNSIAPASPTQRQHVLGRLVYPRTESARLLRSVAVVVIVVFGLLHLKRPLEFLRPEGIYNKDIIQEWTMTRAIVDRVDPYLSTAELAERYLGALPNAVLPHPSPHPPTLALLVLPLAWFDYRTAAILWFGLELVCLLASVQLMGRAVGTRLSLRATLGIAIVLLIWYPFGVDLAWGQLQVPILALLSGAWLALRSQRSALAGALVGLTVLIKAFTLPLLLLFVLRKDWRALVAALSIILGGYWVAGCVLGLEMLQTYFTAVLPSITTYYRSTWGNFSISSLAWRIFYGTEDAGVMIAPPLFRSMTAARLASTGLPLLLWLIACWAAQRQRDLDVSWALMLMVSILTTPIAWSYYLPLAAIPAAQVVRWLERHRLPSRETNLALFVAILLVVPWLELATVLAIRVAVARQTMTLPFALAQLPLMPAVAVGALAWLLVGLGPVGTYAVSEGEGGS